MSTRWTQVETSNGFPFVSTISASFPSSMETDAVSHADVLGGIDGDGAECLKRIHARADSHTGAQRKILLRDNGAVRDNGHMASGAAQNARRLPGLVAHLDLRRMSERRADNHAESRLSQLVRDQVSLRHMLERQPDAELLRNADGRKNIVGAMRMGLERDLTAQHRNQRLSFMSKGGSLLRSSPAASFLRR